MIRALVVSDVRLYREGLADALGAGGRCEAKRGDAARLVAGLDPRSR